MAISKFSAGLGTTPAMWEMVSEALDGEKLPLAISAAIYALCDGSVAIVPREVAAAYDQLCIGTAP